MRQRIRTRRDDAATNIALALAAPQYHVIWQNKVTGDRALWAMNGTTPPSQAIPLNWEKPEWSMVGAADFTADGIPDILFQNTTTGQRGWWVMNGTKWAGWIGTFAEKPEWSMIDVGDVTADGKPDVLLQNTVTGVRGFWEMKDTRFTSWIPIIRIAFTVQDFWSIYPNASTLQKE